MIGIYLAFIFALLSPLIWALMNILDKLTLTHRVRKPLGYVVYVGIANLIFGIILFLFSNWTGVRFIDILFPALAGIFIGVNLIFWYLVIGKEDVSNIVGLMYLYPILVAILSYLFLNEVLSFFSYIGIALIILGSVFLATRMRKFKIEASIWMIGILIVFSALNEFSIKLATNELAVLNGISITLIFMGLAVLPLFLSKEIRKNSKIEFRNFKLALVLELSTLMGTSLQYLAASGLKITIVSAIAALQPLFLVFYERAADKYSGKLRKDHSLIHKLIPILLIIIGVIIIYIKEIV